MDDPLPQTGGIDISEAALDVYAHPAGGERQFTYPPKGHRVLLSAESGPRSGHPLHHFSTKIPGQLSAGINIRCLDRRRACLWLIRRFVHPQAVLHFGAPAEIEAVALPFGATPVVLIVGPHRAGKATLARKMGEAGRTYNQAPLFDGVNALTRIPLLDWRHVGWR
jgi:hypothetical protein